jgi:hypothetical protein
LPVRYLSQKPQNMSRRSRYSFTTAHVNTNLF